MPPLWLIRVAVAGVWVYEGLWCKLLGGEPHQLEVVEAVPGWGKRVGKLFLLSLGAVETALGLWALSGVEPLACVVVQTALLVALNANGLLWARHVIHDPGGMVVKNFAFILLAWVSASLARGG
ncbi:MAG TPA: DoxX-like family protein [Planctomycetota bacterium]|nr:DoxX-like family protein [Planctomycetota bacterium]